LTTTTVVCIITTTVDDKQINKFKIYLSQKNWNRRYGKHYVFMVEGKTGWVDRMKTYLITKGDFHHITSLFDFEVESLRKQGFIVILVSNGKEERLMTNTVKINLAVKPETVAGIERLANETHRGKSDVIDWLVADALDRIEQAQRGSVIVEQIEQSSVVTP